MSNEGLASACRCQTLIAHLLSYYCSYWRLTSRIGAGSPHTLQKRAMGRFMWLQGQTTRPPELVGAIPCGRPLSIPCGCPGTDGLPGRFGWLADRGAPQV